MLLGESIDGITLDLIYPAEPLLTQIHWEDEVVAEVLQLQ